MGRVYNFSAGPAVLPEGVLKEAAAEMLNYKGSGMSVMEMSHRSKPFQDIIDTAEADIRELMNIPDNYKVLFLQRCIYSVFNDSNEYYEKRCGRLYYYRTIRKKSI